MDAQPPAYVFYLFPLFFVAMWLCVTTILGQLSGWFTLQQQFPNRDEESRLTLAMRSGQMGSGANLNGVLKLAACPSGLRVCLLRLFGPFQRPFLVPWTQIRAEPQIRFFHPSVWLTFGDPEIGHLIIDARLWQQIASLSSRPDLVLPLPQAALKRSGFGMALAWMMVSAFVGTFFYYGSRSNGNTGIPLAICIGLPAIFFGAILMVRFLRQVR